MRSDELAIELSAVNVSVPGFTILRDINWSLPRGQRAVILGPNGCGKSTLLRVITGYCHYTSGQVRVLGETLGQTEIHSLRKRLGIYDPSLVRLLDAGVSAEELVATGLFGHLTTYFDRPDEQQLATARDVLAEVGMREQTHQPFETLSSGQLGRAWLARALVHVPELLLLDEPTAAFDLLGRETLLASLGALSRSRPELTRIVVTHHLEEVLPDTDVILLMRKGKVVAMGAPGEVLTSERLSDTFGVPVEVTFEHGRWRWAVRPDVWHALL